MKRSVNNRRHQYDKIDATVDIMHSYKKGIWD